MIIYIFINCNIYKNNTCINKTKHKDYIYNKIKISDFFKMLILFINVNIFIY